MTVRRFLCALALVSTRAGAAYAQPAAPPHDAERLTLSGYLQAQYERIDPADAPPHDRVFFRRMVLTIRAHPDPDWAGTIQFDLAPAASGDSLVVKDALLEYVGWKDRGWTIAIGNQKMPFSRSLLVSSARRGLVERPFPGDRSFGSPGRAIGIRADKWNGARTVLWSAAVAGAMQSPDADEIRINGPADADKGWADGALAVGRLELHPLGETPREHGAFGDSGWKVTCAVAGYIWRNDRDIDVQANAADADDPVPADALHASGIELSAGLRGHRISLDAEYSRAEADSRAGGLTEGLYVNGKARLNKGALEGGYMVRRHVLEIVGAVDLLAAGTFDRAWTRGAAGLSWHVAGTAARFQVMERLSRNDHGVSGAHSHATYLQAQFSF